MSHEQPRRAEEGEQVEAIKYGDVFEVSGELSSKPIAPKDANTMQSAESHALGKTHKGGAASLMQSAAAKNEISGFVRHDDATYSGAPRKGVTVSETQVAGTRILAEAIGGQVVGKYVEPGPVKMKAPAGAPEPKEIPIGEALKAVKMQAPAGNIDKDSITIGEALEATTLSAGNKPVDQGDAAAIQAAEVRAIGRTQVIPGGLTATAQSAAAANAGITSDKDKIKLANVLKDATMKLPVDKVVTREDAEGITAAEIRNKPDTATATELGGVAAAVTAAARFNQGK